MTAPSSLRGSVLLPTAACALALVAGSPVTARQGPQEKQVVVTVMDVRSSRPAAGVTASALAVREDGQSREIVKVEPAASAMSVVLLADTTTAFSKYTRELRASSQTFLSAVMTARPDSSAALWEFGGAAMPVTSFTKDAAALGQSAARLRPKEVVVDLTTEASSNLLTAVFDAARALGKQPEPRHVIVSFNAATSLETGKLTKQQVQAELQKAGVSWFAVTFADGGSSSPLRDSVMTELIPASGGLRLTVSSASSLEPAMKALADALAAQYLVSYKRPSGSPKELQVEVMGDGLKAFAQRWAPK